MIIHSGHPRSRTPWVSFFIKTDRKLKITHYFKKKSPKCIKKFSRAKIMLQTKVCNRTDAAANVLNFTERTKIYGL